MGRQNTRTQTGAAVRNLQNDGDIRLDPQALPHRFRYRTGLDGEAGIASVVLDRDLACICRRLPSGIPMAMRMKVSAFEGVAVRFAADPAGGDDKVVLELLHRDPNLSLPLAVARDLDDVVADWRSWGKTLSLPLLIVEADGSYHAVEARIGAVDVRAPRPRRRRSILARRRPRFLVRRKPGVIPAEPTFVTGRVITSWE